MRCEREGESPGRMPPCCNVRINGKRRAAVPQGRDARVEGGRAVRTSRTVRETKLLHSLPFTGTNNQWPTTTNGRPSKKDARGAANLVARASLTHPKPRCFRPCRCHVVVPPGLALRHSSLNIVGSVTKELRIHTNLASYSGVHETFAHFLEGVRIEGNVDSNT